MQQLILVLSTMISASIFARNIYVNGVDITSANNQEMRKVDVRIDERGDIHISAPHYVVHEQESYHPLSSQTMKSKPETTRPMHKTMAPLTTGRQSAVEQAPTSQEDAPASPGKPASSPVPMP